MLGRYLKLLAQTQAVGEKARAGTMSADPAYYAAKSVAILPVLHAGTIVIVLDLLIGRTAVWIVVFSALFALTVAIGVSVLFDRGYVDRAIDELSLLNSHRRAVLLTRSKVFVFGSWVAFLGCAIVAGRFGRVPS